jgi:hypothetical protein
VEWLNASQHLIQWIIGSIFSICMPSSRPGKCSGTGILSKMG